MFIRILLSFFQASESVSKKLDIIRSSFCKVLSCVLEGKNY